MPRAPRLVEFSVWFYRLLLAAYPAEFRKDYGEAMASLFRDSALDGYRRRGALGLLTLWPRTLLDFVVSMVRQHQDKAAEVDSELRLLRDLLGQWGQLGSVVLSVTSVSVWYTLHVSYLYFRRSALVWATLASIALGFWVGSFFESIGTGPEPTSLRLASGAVEIYHHRLAGEPISDEQWRKDWREWRQQNPTAPSRLSSEPWPWEINWISEIPGASVVKLGPNRIPAVVRPYKSWRLRFPFLPLPLLLLCGALRAWRRGQAASGPALQSA